MPIRYTHEPSPYVEGALAFFSGFGEQRARKEEIESGRQAEQQQRLADSLGGAIGDIGVGYYRGKEKRYMLDREERLLEERDERARRLRIDSILADDYGIFGGLEELDRARTAGGQEESRESFLSNLQAEQAQERMLAEQMARKQVRDQEMMDRGFVKELSPRSKAELEKLENWRSEVMLNQELSPEQRQRALDDIDQRVDNIQPTWQYRDPPMTPSRAREMGLIEYDPDVGALIGIDPETQKGYRIADAPTNQGTDQYAKIEQKAWADAFKMSMAKNQPSETDVNATIDVDKIINDAAEIQGKLMAKMAPPPPMPEAPIAPPQTLPEESAFVPQRTEPRESIADPVSKQADLELGAMLDRYGEDLNQWPKEAFQQARAPALQMFQFIRQRYPDPLYAPPEVRERILLLEQIVKRSK